MTPLYTVNVHCCDEIGGPTPLALNTEWLLTDGLGGFAMGTVSGCATRRYHGLLIAAARPPVERFNTLAAVAETLRIDGHEHHLDCHEYFSPEHHTVFHPHGYQYLHKFEKAAAPASVRWHYRVGSLAVTKELRIVWRRPAAVITYTVEPLPGAGENRAGQVTLEVVPLLAMRDFHQHRRPDWGDPFQVEAANEPDGARLQVRADIPVPLHMAAWGGGGKCFFSGRRDWWHNFRRRRETERGQDDLEDLFAPGAFVCTFAPGDGPYSLRLYASTEPIDRGALDTDDGREEHLQRIERNIQRSTPNVQRPSAPGSGLSRLVAASDDFVVTRFVGGDEFRTILAGYPWFADWGRDTMISLPGLLLCTGRLDEAAQTLITFARHIRNGLVPNRFDDYGGEPHYNTADASLWFIHACLEYRRVCPNSDRRVWREVLAPACRDIIRAYREGTDGPIKMDDDGLIAAGNEQTQLTWMDAKRDGVVFTPRWGKCVEINALWHRALAGCAAAMWDEDAPTAAEYEKLAQKVKRSFGQTFWSDELGYLLDHVNAGGADRSLRPNQMFAVSLPTPLLTQVRQKKVMAIARDKLLTPMGPRTLGRDDANYCGLHCGSMFDRDKAYHQGTVWPWLIGPYVEGWLRAHEFSLEARAHGREALAPLLDQLHRRSLGQLPEIYDGDAPHNPSGTIAQAWSVAETLRTLVLVESPDA